MASVNWHYYLRDDSLVYRANASRVDFFALGEWALSAQYGNEPALLQKMGAKLTKISAAKARSLIK